MSAPPQAAASLDRDPESFRALGHRLVDRLTDYYASLDARPVAVGAPPRSFRPAPLPETGTAAGELLEEATDRLTGEGVHLGHPRFLAYVGGPGSPLAALAELLAAAVNPNVAAAVLTPWPSRVEVEVVRWLAAIIGMPEDTGGLLVSGGNVANTLGLVAALEQRLPWSWREEGLRPRVAPGDGAPPRPRLYASREVHNWLEKAVRVLGLGAAAIRWIASDDDQRLVPSELERAVEDDRRRGFLPLAVVASAGTVSTGAVDPLPELACLARRLGLWLHVDGAYGAVARVAPEAPRELAGLAEADSVAVDPHKWVYVPYEAGCLLTRRPEALRRCFRVDAPYYRFGAGEAGGGSRVGEGTAVPDFLELGLQNSRGFRALKVWLTLRQLGRSGLASAIGRDIRLARRLFDGVRRHPRLEALTSGLSVATFRYIPTDPAGAVVGSDLDTLNSTLLSRLQTEGRYYLSSAVVGGRFALRACIANYRTSEEDVDALPEEVARLGDRLVGSAR